MAKAPAKGKGDHVRAGKRKCDENAQGDDEGDAVAADEVMTDTDAEPAKEEADAETATAEDAAATGAKAPLEAR